MVSRAIIIAAAALMAAGCASEQNMNANPQSTPQNATQSSSGANSVLRHIVFFKFKDDASEQEVREVVDAFRALPEQIPEIRDLEWGTNVNPEGKAHGYTHGFLVTFDNEADRDVYLPHPAHQAFGEKLGPILDKVLVFDYHARQ